MSSREDGEECVRPPLNKAIYSILEETTAFVLVRDTRFVDHCKCILERHWSQGQEASLIAYKSEGASMANEKDTNMEKVIV